MIKRPMNMQRLGHKISAPTRTTLDGPRDGGTVRVFGSKPPKLRFRPGQIVRYKNELYEVMYAYRVRETPHEWFYSLEERKGLSENLDAIGQFLQAAGCGATTPRLVYEMFRDHGDASKFFFDIPLNGGRTTVPNKMLIQHATLISDGLLVR